MRHELKEYNSIILTQELTSDLAIQYTILCHEIVEDIHAQQCMYTQLDIFSTLHQAVTTICGLISTAYY